MAENRLPAHITEHDLELITTIVAPAILEASRSELMRLLSVIETAGRWADENKEFLPRPMHWELTRILSGAAAGTETGADRG